MLRRLLRLRFNISAVVSAVLCVAVGGLWVRSYFASDEVTVVRPPRTPAGLVEHSYMVATSRGAVQWNHGSTELPDAESAARWRSDLLLLDPSRAEVRWVRGPADDSQIVRQPNGADPERNDPTVRWFHNSALGIEWYDQIWSASYGRSRWQYLLIAYRLPFLLLAVLPLVWLYRRRIYAARRRRGHCPVCGYDLRASPGRCPECGTAPAAPAR